MEDCKCKNPEAAIITTCFMGKYEDWQANFVKEHAGKLVCYNCGGFVDRSIVGNNYDHVTATTTTERLRELGKI